MEKEPEYTIIATHTHWDQDSDRTYDTVSILSPEMTLEQLCESRLVTHGYSLVDDEDYRHVRTVDTVTIKLARK